MLIETFKTILIVVGALSTLVVGFGGMIRIGLKPALWFYRMAVEPVLSDRIKTSLDLLLKSTPPLSGPATWLLLNLGRATE